MRSARAYDSFRDVHHTSAAARLPGKLHGPQELYETVKRRGMDLVTVTDHDSIGAAESLRKYPDFFLSEEVSCTLPGGSKIYAGVYGIDEPQHLELQRRRDDFESFAAYVAEQRLFYSVNHIFSSLTGHRPRADAELLRQRAPVIETRNGAIPAFCNRAAELFASAAGAAVCAGSDTHTIGAAGYTWTEAGGARDKEEFLAAVRSGQAIVHGDHGAYSRLTQDVIEIAREFLAARREFLPLGPLVLLVPFVTAANFAQEFAFAGFRARRQPLHLVPDRLVRIQNFAEP